MGTYMHKDTNKKQLNDTEEKLHGLENTGSRYRDLSSCAAYVRKAHMPRFRMVDSSAAASFTPDYSVNIKLTPFRQYLSVFICNGFARKYTSKAYPRYLQSYSASIISNSSLH